jgi:cold shock CspA family protein
MDGLVKWYSPEKGYGWIMPLIGKPDSTPDLYFHISAVRDGLALPAGARVSFVIVRGTEGRQQAADIQVKQERLRRGDGTGVV